MTFENTMTIMEIAEAIEEHRGVLITGEGPSGVNLIAGLLLIGAALEECDWLRKRTWPTTFESRKHWEALNDALEALRGRGLIGEQGQSAKPRRSRSKS